MAIKKLTQNISVSGQIAPADIAAIAASGFHSIICNRPDGEESGQPDWNAVRDAAQSAGLEARSIPIAGADDIEARKHDFAEAMAQMPKPILAYCRTGNRCTVLFQAATAEDQN